MQKLLYASLVCLTLVSSCKPQDEPRPVNNAGSAEEVSILHKSFPGHISGSLVLQNGDIIACGRDEHGDAAVWQISSQINMILWKRSYAATEFGAFTGIVRASSGYMICGSKTSEQGDMDIHISRLSDEGNVAWHKSIGGPTDEVNVCMTAIRPKEYVVLAAQKNSSYDIFDTWIDEAGNNWSILFDEPGEQIPYHALKNEIDVVTITGSDADNIASSNKFYLNKFSPFTGSQLKISKQLEGHTIAPYTAEPDDKSLVSCGSSSVNGKVYGFLSKTSSSGNLLWSKRYGADHNLILDRVMQDGDRLICTGYSYEGCETCSNRGVVICTDMNGNELWRQEYETEKDKGEQIVNYIPSRKMLIVNSKDTDSGEERFFLMTIDEHGEALD